MGKLTVVQLSDLLPYLTRLGRRLRLRDTLLVAQRWLWLAALGAVLTQTVGRITPLESLRFLTLVPLGLWLMAVLGFSILHPLPTFLVAHRVDIELGLKERLSTAVVLSDSAYPSFSEFLRSRQHEDALYAVRSIEAKRALPLKWSTRPILVAMLLTLAAITMAALPNPMDGVLAERAAVAETAEEQAEKVEALREEITDNEELSAEEREQLLRELAELTAQLRQNPGDRAEALADLSTLERSLRERVDLNASQRQAALEALASQLRSMASADLGETPELSGALEKLAEQLADMEADERGELAQTLAQMAARASQSGNVELAQALATLAQAAQSGEGEALSQTAQTASNAFSQAQTDLADQAALQRALDQIQESRQAIAQAGQGKQSMASSQGQPGQGQSQGQGPGQGQGQGQNQGQGQGQQPGSGAGTKSNTLPPATGTGKASDPNSPGQSADLEAFESQVYAPFETGTENSDPLVIPGQDTGQGETQVREDKNPFPGASNPALVPYRQVYEKYKDAASQAIDQSYIPAGLKDYVREYFSNLEP